MTKEKKYNLIVIGAVIIAGLLYCYTIISLWLPQWLEFKHLIFNWPDANANYFFAQVFAKTGHFYWSEPLNTISQNLIHTRSINVFNGNLVPMTFLPAILIFGVFFKIFGAIGVLFVTPVLAALSGYIVYRLANYIFKDLDLSLITSLLFLSLAPWVFFANEVMLPTILFIFLVFLGWLMISQSWHKGNDKYHWRWLSGCLLLALAIVVRPTELIWLAVISALIFYFNKDKISRRHILEAGGAFVVIFISFLLLNKLTYGNWFTLGYADLQSGAAATEFDRGTGFSLGGFFKLLVAPFGFDFTLILKNFWKYFVKIIVLHFVLATLGLIMIWRDKTLSLVWRRYLLLTPIIFILIFLYYGSWNLADPLVKELNTISISYVRYFMPLYIWILPATVLAINKIFFKVDRKSSFGNYILFITLILSSLQLAFFAANDGLIANQKNLLGYYAQFAAVKKVVTEQAVIITDREDKIFFPYYRVVVPQNNPLLWSRLSKIVGQVPIYYYTSKAEEQLSQDRQEMYKLNLTLTEPQDIWHNFRLYQVLQIK